MIFSILIALTIVTSTLCAVDNVTFPVNPCKQNSSNYSACLKNALEELWPQLVEGLPEINFPPLDPFFYDYSKAVFNRGQIYGEINVFNITITGIRKTHFLVIRPYIYDDKYRFEIDVEVPRLVIDGDCNAIGSLGGIRMGGKGHFNLTLEDIRGTWDLTGHVVNDTWTVEHFRFLPTVRNMKIYLNNLFDNNKELNDLAMFFVNEYWPTLYRAMLPITSKNWDSWLTGLSNRLFSKVSFSKLFP
ncbi:uncharacterized protein LOC126857635 isoform X1 [Cataglyphis hispanica]|uniref:uncharacterized protein LOC126857635 isoform X1 n=1 Tax=Cataglyphis hispanica TaxID=1086592 RepID=UPI00217FDB8A|nr:uncharacterized protein LOC126857635 isoform X1 [Cataglyphis hispanica]